MNKPIKEEFSFLTFLNDIIKKSDLNDMDIDENLKDINIFECISESFKTFDENDWLKPEQSCSVNVKNKFEEIFKKYFKYNE